MNIDVIRKDIEFKPNPRKVIARFFYTNEDRAKILIKNIIDLSDKKADSYTIKTLREFQKRHRNISKIFISHYHQVKHLVKQMTDTQKLSASHKILIGSYFTMEYAVESAALFNPSIVEDPDQEGITNDAKRIIISFRATGEGHVSSIIFKRALIDKYDNIIPSEDGTYVGKSQYQRNHRYTKKEFIAKLEEKKIPLKYIAQVIDPLPSIFEYYDLENHILSIANGITLSVKNVYRNILNAADYNYEVEFSYDSDISERVIFPHSASESKGIEDARFVRFVEDNGDIKYYATYTGYDGRKITPKLIVTTDFYKFKVHNLHGEFAKDKNLALFPRKINGKYVMLSRYDSVNNYVMTSDDILVWNNAKKISGEKNYWEFVQVGNCGSPIETKHGWLLITHGVGPVRSYNIGAYLLDINEPSKVTKRLPLPLLMPTREERTGYVPNVVYSCGCYLKDDTLFIPYAVSDYASKFATVNLQQIIDNMDYC